jgi:cation diffusion facilitator family transporter
VFLFIFGGVMIKFRLTKRVGVLGMAANIFLLVIKLAAGYLSRSQAMIADGFNSAGDVFASVMTLIGNRIASKPVDKDHPYGHGKAEHIFSLIISLSLMVVGVQVLKSSVYSIVNREKFAFSLWLVTVALATIIIKLTLYIYTRTVGKRTSSLLIAANAADHRNDVLLTTGTLLGILFGLFGIYWADGVVGLGISAWIIITGVRIFFSAYRVLMDTNIDQPSLDKIRVLVEAIPGVDHVDDITSKPIGENYIIIIKVSVDRSLSVEEGHDIAAQVKYKLKDSCKNNRLSDVVVHVNPV